MYTPPAELVKGCIDPGPKVSVCHCEGQWVKMAAALVPI